MAKKCKKIRQFLSKNNSFGHFIDKKPVFGMIFAGYVNKTTPVTASLINTLKLTTMYAIIAFATLVVTAIVSLF
jgi:hypothetical protein